MHSEDIQKGDWITVVSWKKRERFHENTMTGQVVVETIQDRSFCGDLLEVLAVDHPFIVVNVDKYRNTPGFPDIVTSLNLTEVKVQKCTDEYVAALKKKA